jgi:two-component system, cell cycle response regulator DivK
MSTVLIVEDAPQLREVMKIALESQGFEIVTAKDGAAGLSAALSLQPDAILLDIMLPELSGWEVMERLQKHPSAAAIPVIGMSAFAEGWVKEKAERLGFADFLIKPVRLQQIAAALAAAISAEQPPPFF